MGFTIEQLEDILAMHQRNLGVAQRRRPRTTSGPQPSVKGMLDREQARVDRAQRMLDEAKAAQS